MKNIYLKSEKNKYSFSQVFDPLASRWSIIIKSHWRMLCPNTQAVINGYAAGWGPRPFFPKRAEIWIWGWKKCIYEKGEQSHFLQISRNLDLWMGIFYAAKKMYRAVIRIY